MIYKHIIVKKSVVIRASFLVEGIWYFRLDLYDFYPKLWYTSTWCTYVA